MSSDPRLPVDSGILSGGYVIRQPVYKAEMGSNSEVKIRGHTGLWDMPHEVEQELVSPFNPKLNELHPCSELNARLGKCSMQCPPEMLLAGRVAACNEERKALMVCFTKHKKWTMPENPPLSYKLKKWTQRFLDFV
jgi:hypothetical protein